MKATFKRQYRKQETGKLVVVYAVSGTEAELKEYEKSKGAHFRTDRETKEPLLFSNRYVGKKADMIKTEKGEFIADTTEFDQLANLADQYGIDVALRIAGKQAEVEE